jgi:hypothetical protein
MRNTAGSNALLSRMKNSLPYRRRNSREELDQLGGGFDQIAKEALAVASDLFHSQAKRSRYIFTAGTQRKNYR